LEDGRPLPINHLHMVSSRHRPLIFAVWAACAIVPVAGLMAKHVAPFARSGHAGFPAAARWRVRHVLVAGCECSSVVAHALVARAPWAGVDERVILAGPDAAIESTFRGTGWTVEVVAPDQVRDTYHVPGGPWLLIADPAGHERYAGGYAASRPVHVWEVDDRRLIEAALRGAAVASQPAFGCMASASLGAS